MRYAYGGGPLAAVRLPSTRMKPRSRYMAHSSSFTHERSSSRARCSARRSRAGSCACAAGPRRRCFVNARQRLVVRAALRAISGNDRTVAKSASARRASSTSAAGGSREEDHAIRLPRHLCVVLHHHRFTTPRVGVDRRDGSPHALVELAAEFLDEQLFLGLNPRVALSEQNLSVPGLHAQQLHEGTDLMTAGW